MSSLVERLESELDELISLGDNLLEKIRAEEVRDFTLGYQDWYTRGLAVVRQLLPDRLHDFQSQYTNDKRKRVGPKVLEDYVLGLFQSSDERGEFNIHYAAYSRLHTQLTILKSAKTRLSDVLANISGVLQADLFDSELDAARDLKKNGHLRAAGAVAGVVLEGHLKELCHKHQVKVPKKKPTLADYNQDLTAARILDGTDSLWIQRLATIRNLCDHKKTREPRLEEVEELIDGADKAISTLK